MHLIHMHWRTYIGAILKLFVLALIPYDLTLDPRNTELVAIYQVNSHNLLIRLLPLGYIIYI